jgi:hypothetical protein
LEQQTEPEEVESPTPPATQPPRERPTLPPTWTPTFTVTPIEPVSTPTESLPPPPPPPAQIREECGTFAPDLGQSTERIRLGERPTLYWTPVAGAALYRLYIFDENNLELSINERTPLYQWIGEETFHTVPEDVFQLPIRYGWEAQPLDAAGIQICVGRGHLINAR